jgi:hypothetical protein
VFCPAVVDDDDGEAVLDVTVLDVAPSLDGSTQMPFWQTRFVLGCADTQPAVRPGPPPPGASVPPLPAAQTPAWQVKVGSGGASVHGTAVASADAGAAYPPDAVGLERGVTGGAATISGASGWVWSDRRAAA